MTKHEFCQLMAAGHRRAAEELRQMYLRADKENESGVWLMSVEQDALHRAFGSLAKEHENE